VPQELRRLPGELLGGRDTHTGALRALLRLEPLLEQRLFVLLDQAIDGRKRHAVLQNLGSNAGFGEQV
jgi:hypothetical protein